MATDKAVDTVELSCIGSRNSVLQIVYENLHWEIAGPHLVSPEYSQD